MGMPLPVPSYTTDDLDRFPQDGNRYELLDGMLLVTPAPVPPHQIIIARLVAALHNYLEPKGLAHVVGPGAVEVAPKTHLEPDLLVFPSTRVPRSRWREIRGWWLACEVFSESSVLYDRDHKRDAYLAIGVREVWLVNRWDRVIEVSRPGAGVATLHYESLPWQPPEMQEPLRLDLEPVFRGMD